MWRSFAFVQLFKFSILLVLHVFVFLWFLCFCVSVFYFFVWTGVRFPHVVSSSLCRHLLKYIACTVIVSYFRELSKLAVSDCNTRPLNSHFYVTQCSLR